MTKRILPLIAVCALAFSASAQQSAKPPKAQLWIDLSTGGMAGMPEMEMPAGMGGLLGGRPGMGSNTAYGTARGMNITPARVLDIALYNSLKPGTEASQAIPAGMRMGDSLPLVPPRGQAVRESEAGEVPEDMRRDIPKGRILIYWGCGDAVRRGQPRVIDMGRGNPADFAAAFAGRYAPDRGARVSPAHALFPNEKNRVSLARDSSLVGEHRVQGEGVPASMKFALGATQDLMPAIELQTRGQLSESIALNWRPVTHARAYYLHAMGQVGSDMVMWSSAETGDTGMGLFDYLPNATIDRWLKESVLLKPETTQCAVPKGIFAGTGGVPREEGAAMLRMVGYGSESNIVFPPRPADPRAAWEPEWAVRVRVKANTMAMLGETGAAASPAARAAEPVPAPAAPSPASALESVLPIPGVGNILRGILGR